MLEQLNRVKNIYDLLALCASYILKEIVENPYEFSLFNDDDFDFVYEAIERYCLEVQEIGRRKAFDELKRYLLSYMEPEITIEKCFAIVKYIDDLVELTINDKLLGSTHIIKYDALNGEYKDKVRIIPKIKETIIQKADAFFLKNTGSDYSLLRDRRECSCSVLDAETVNYMIWDKNNIDKYPEISIYHLDEKHPITKHFFQKEDLVFGIVPFTNKEINELLEVKYQQKAFYIEQMFDLAEDELKSRFNRAYKKCKADVDFLVFPEMLITEEMISSIKNKSKTDSPWIIINGSIWKNRINKTIVTDSKGTEIFNYCKKEPYKYEDNHKQYKEWLDQKYNREYSIMEIEGFGRVGIGICKDLVSEEVKLFHKYIGTDILIVPAYTSSMDLQGGAEELSQEYNCVVVVANACSALGETKDRKKERRLGFITLPGKKGTDRTALVIRYNQNQCIKNCEQECVGKKIQVNFYKTKEYKDENVVSYEVKEDIL